uniref:Protein NO VEIN C-terminal domain-containing protein n=1 Tax=Zea mays TaxID=4577 RepID=A0A804M5T2_MAIZE
MNSAALAAYQLQQQQAHHFASHAYHQAPTGNTMHRSTKPAAAAKPAPPPGNQQAVLDRAQEAARKAREELVKGGDGVTAWKVAQAVLVALKADSWDSLGVQPQDVPLLRDLFLIEGKVNAFIHCYVAARKIVTVYDLEVEICKNEGVVQFEELGLGPFLQHPLVAHYFLVPADLSVVPKLCSEEIINTLLKFVDKSKKKITIEDFLNHLAEKKSVSGKEKLGVRVQSLGLHISLLRQAKQTEVSAAKLRANMSGSGNSSQEKDLLKNASFHTHKKALDKRFISLTNRIKELPGINKHIHFDSTDDETNSCTGSEDGKSDGNENENECSILDKKDGDKRVNSCPYPSKTEELERLGLKSEINKRQSLENSKPRDSGKKGKVSEKRKYEEIGSPSCSFKQPKKQQKLQKHEASPKCFLSIGKLENFVTTWKETCREHPVQQVLEMLANYYGRTISGKRRIRNFFSQYPGIGLLNVAVKSMGCGLLDSIYDVIQLADENDVASSPPPNTTTEVMEIEPPSKENTGSTNGAHEKSEDNMTAHGVAIDDVIRRISEYIESNSKISGDVALQVRALNDCETWVTTQFSANQFSALGHGTFLEFLDKHCHQFRTALSSFFKEGPSNSSSLEVSVLQQQIEFLLCQAESNWLEDSDFSEDSFVMLLKKQFPTISFNIVQDKSDGGVSGFIEGQKKDIRTYSLKFSISLLEKRWSGTLPSRHGNVDELGNIVAEQSCYHTTVCSREAINCLLRAPMLSDLHLWSHWDSLFAPTLGSFVHWLLNTGPIQELACIATTDGRFIRVDSSATVDQFLEAIIHRSPLQVAVKLLSLLYIYNGSMNTPMSLLKCYAQRAIKLIVDNNNDLMNAKSENKIFMPDEPQNLSSESSTCFADQCQESSQASPGRLIRSDSLPNINNTVHLITKFVLDCLDHLPSEFRSLAADILLAGFRVVTKNWHAVMLHEATENGQLCMLHDIGLSLGVVEWVEDCHRLCLTDEVHVQTEMHSSAKLATPASVGATHEDSNMHISSDVNMMDKRKQLFPVINDRAGIDKEDNKMLNPAGTEADVAELHTTSRSSMMEETSLEEASLVIETIRREEFGLDQALSDTENSLLKKQHARLGRALHCLSQELYSQDSHLLLELVQNADDNTYPEDVEATLAFILQEDGIAVLNNERGFSAENIRALCDIGNSTKKGSNQGYIGNKGIGFKSVFRVTDAPEIHSNGFHVKFDITDGQIGFVLPTAVPPYSTTSFSRMLSVEDDKDAHSLWNTCILLPFRSKFRECTGMCSIVSLFSDLHPSLLLFLHRLKCIKFKNLFDDTLLIMRREILGDGIVRISHGIETMSWLVVSKRLQGTIVRHDVCTTEIAVAFTLQQTEEGDYEPYLKQQPVFAFLPLRNYGLKFILQGDFVLPSSREEVDADSAWNQWLLSEFPSLFVSAQESFCALPCFQRCPGKAVTAFLSFIPLAGEVHGFFSQLPHLILSKLRLTRCMFLDGSTVQWVYPCNTLRGWDEQTKMLFSEGLLHEHLGLGYLSKNIVISDKLSRALGIHDYGPNILLDAISSICRIDGCIESLGLEWLCAWFVNLYLTLLSHSSQNVSSARNLEDILLDKVRKIPCIPLSDGSFTSISDGRIWLPYDVASSIPECSSIPNFPALYGNLRTVVKVEKTLSQVDSILAGGLSLADVSTKQCTVYDWESPELSRILSIFSSKRCKENCVYLLEVLDRFWDDHYSAKSRIFTDATHCGENRAVESSFMKCIQSFKWIASRMDEDLHYATDLFYDCENVRSLFGSVAPYAVPQVSSSSLKKAIGFKTEVSYCDALMVLKSWITSKVPFRASMSQMCKFYTFLSEGVADAKIDIKREFMSSPSIFTPLQRPRASEVIPGRFLAPEDLYWHDPTGCSEITEDFVATKNRSMFPRKMLSAAYPNLYELFTLTCGVPKAPTTSNYVEMLLRLSTIALPSQAGNHVFCVFVRWAKCMHSESDKMNDILYLKESLQKLETTILPTSADKWVSLHPSFGLVCWVDDDELKQQFVNSNDVYFIQFGDLSSEDKQMLYGRVAALMKSLGIQALSKVVYREAIFYGTSENREKVSLICWLLPYMQRYIYKMHRDTYINFQKNDIMKISNLQVVVVDKLFHKYVLRGLESSSKKRFQCHCLLQGDTLYATQEADSHSVFLELSRIFFDGSHDLHFANFLHMIKTMAESGTHAEQIETFIVNNQNVPELPEHEAIWSFSSLSAAKHGSANQGGADTQGVDFQPVHEFSIPNHQKAQVMVSSWPLNYWRTAPVFRTPLINQHASMQEAKVNDAGPSSNLNMPAMYGHTEDSLLSADLERDWIIEENPRTETTLFGDSSSEILDEPQMVMSAEPFHAPAYLNLEAGNSSPTVHVELTNSDEKLANLAEDKNRRLSDASQLRTGSNPMVDVELTNFDEKLANLAEGKNQRLSDASQLRTGSNPMVDVELTNFDEKLAILAEDKNQRLSDANQLRTGRLGEELVEKYLAKQLGSNNVRWVNNRIETGLPYDIVITHPEGFTEYVEVKTTVSSRKDWFDVSAREWQFALEKGDSFSIARVILGTKKASIEMLKNPHKLCKQKALRLALLISRSAAT